MAKFNYNLRNPGKLEVSPIYLIVRYNGLKLVYPTKENIPSKYWDFAVKRAKSTKRFPEHPYLNERLDHIDVTAKDVFRRFLLDHENRPPTINELREKLNIQFLKLPDPGTLNFISFVNQFINEATIRANERTGKPLSQVTIQGYKNTLALVEGYSKHRKVRVDFDTVDLDFYYGFIEYLNIEQDFATNTIGKHIKNLKVFLNNATERGYNTNLAYKSRKFQVVGEEVEKVYLNEAELSKIYKLNLSKNKKLERVRDLFLMGCWTGLRFSDLANLQPANFNDGFIEIEMKKTREKVVIPIHPVVSEIMNRYKHTYNSLPPIISNAKTNAYLKDIMKMVKTLKKEIVIKRTRGGVERHKKFKKHELITVHTARRSFATNLYLSDFPSISIMKITGHQTEAAFLGYIKVTPKENAKLLQVHWDKQFGSV